MEETHIHAEDDGEALERSHPLWRTDRIELRSVGIDIGSSTSHLIFSTLVLRRQSAVLSSRFELVERRVDYASPILLTPFSDGASLDAPSLSAFLNSAYVEAGIDKARVDTGAVITTGDAARKDNAEAVVRLFSEQAGKFVCASAGPLLEAKMAAYGSGAVGRSAQGDSETTVLNVDIGGGTTKLAIVRGGRVIEATAINVGARLITFDRSQTLTKVERAAHIAAQSIGLRLEVGALLTERDRRDLASVLVGALFEVVARRIPSKLTHELMIATPLAYAGKIDVVFFSGGVSEYYYQHDTPRFGDIGPLIARLLRQGLSKELPGVKVERPAQGIRATVIGASQFTAQVSGNTLYIGAPECLPIRNLQVVIVTIPDGEIAAGGVRAAIQKSFEDFEVDESSSIALSIRWPHGPAYAKIDALATGVAQAAANLRRHGLPIVLILDVDIARLTGAILSQRSDGYAKIICIDGVDLQEFDYVDISEEHPDSHVVTVVVKSLIFTG